MSATRNINSINPKQGEFHPSVPRDEPLTTKGHQPGRKVAPSDFAEEFHVQPVPEGTGPRDRVFDPNPVSEVPSQAINDNAYTTPASDTLGGTDSAQVYTGLGKPLQGEDGREMHHDGKHKRKHERSGLEGVGANPKHPGPDERNQPWQRGLERDEALAGQRSDKADPASSRAAENMVPEPAETVARERD